MVRLIILASYIATLLIGPANGFVLCYHPDHGLRIESGHEKTKCTHTQAFEKIGIQKSETSCIDTPVYAISSNIPNIPSLEKVLSSPVVLYVLCIPTPVSLKSELTSFSPFETFTLRSISSTILRL